MRRQILAAAFALAVAAPSLGHAAEKRRTGGESFIQLPTLTATLVHADGSRGVLSVEAGLDAPDPAVEARAEGLQPRLLDAYVQVLSVYARAIPPGGPPNLDVLGLELQRATDRVLGRAGAHFLFGSVIVN